MCGSRTVECPKWRKSAGWGLVKMGIGDASPSASTLPLDMWLAGLEVGLEQAGEGCLGAEGSVYLENERGMHMER